jgi:hypothetical protein
MVCIPLYPGEVPASKPLPGRQLSWRSSFSYFPQFLQSVISTSVPFDIPCNSIMPCKATQPREHKLDKEEPISQSSPSHGSVRNGSGTGKPVLFPQQRTSPAVNLFSLSLPNSSAGTYLSRGQALCSLTYIHPFISFKLCSLVTTACSLASISLLMMEAATYQTTQCLSTRSV